MDKLLLEKAAFELLVALHKTGGKVMGRAICGIVEMHAACAAVIALLGAWISLLGCSVVILINAAIIWTMYLRINSKIGIPFRKNACKTVLSGVFVNVSNSVVMSVVAAIVLSLIPVVDIVGDLIMTVVGYVVTWSSGLFYLKIMTRFAEIKADVCSICEDDLKKMAREVLEKEAIRGLKRVNGNG